MKISKFLSAVFFVLILSSVVFSQGEPTLTQIKFLIDGQAVNTTSYEDIRVQLIFSEPMDQTVPPTVKFGLSEPFGFSVPEGQGWISSTLWQGLFTVSDANPNDDDGEYNFQIFSAKDVGGTEMDTTLSSSLEETLLICRSGKVALSTTTLDFDTLIVGTNKILTVTITNESCAILQINNITMPAPFSLYESANEFTILANSTAQFRVRFIPGARTSYSGTLTINSNDRQQNEHTIQLLGSAKGPKIALSPGTAMNFDKVELGENSTLSMYVINVETANPVYSDTLIVSSTVATHSVYQAEPTSFSVAPGDSQKVDVTFTPTQRTSYNGNSLRFTSNDLTAQLVAFTLNGNANDDSPPPPPGNLIPTWSGFNGYVSGLYLPVCWDNPDDPSGIAEIWWKFSQSNSPPTSEDDTTAAGGRYVIGEGESCTNLNLTGRINSGFWNCYIWLVDGRGNSGYTNYVPTSFTYDTEAPRPPLVVDRSIDSGNWFDDADNFDLTIEIPANSGSGTRDAVEVRWKYRVQPESGSDYSGRFQFTELPNNRTTFNIPFSSTSLCGEDEVYIWLADSAGNASPDSITAVDYNFDICSGFVTNFSATWSGFNGYARGQYLPICWSLEGGQSQIASIYWKFSRTPVPPTSASDTTAFGGSIALAEGANCANLTLLGKITSGRWYCYAWAVFNTGNNSSYLNPITTTFTYDTNAPGRPVINDWEIPTHRWFGANDLYRLAIQIPFDPDRNIRDAAEVRWKFKSQPTSGNDYASRFIFSDSNPELRVVEVIFDSEELCGEDSLYIWLADSAGNVSSDSVAFTRYRFDICPPQITRFHQDTVNVAQLGQSYMDTLVITDDSNVDTAWVRYRFGGAEAEEPPRPLTRIADTDSFIVEIPPAGVTRRGLEFRITASDSLQNTGIGPVETDICETDSVWFPVQTRITGAGDYRVDLDGRPVPLITGADSTNYQLFSIPYALDSSDVLTVLEDDLGDYDITKWRFFDYMPNNPETTRYLEGEDARPFEPGRSFFLLTNQEDIVVGSGPGASVLTVCTDSVRLYQGWNLVATPFNFPVDKESLSLINSNSSISLRSYERGWNIVDRMEPWKGYALFVTPENDNDDPMYLVVRPRAAAGRLAKNVDERMALSPDEWQIQISAAAGNVYDTENWLGVKSDAGDGFDRFDMAEPPVIGNFVKVAFPHTDWNLPVDDFSADFRPSGEIDNTWEFAVTTNKIKTQVSLNFQFLGNVPENSEVYLVDEAAEFSQNLKTNPVYNFTSSKSLTKRSLKIIVGSLDYTIAEAGDIGLVPEAFELMQNYPNPFNPETKIRYNLPAAGSVKVEIFDLLGRTVATLVDNSNHRAGYHIATWNGKNGDGRQVASGVYVYRLTTANQTLVRKMLLMK